MRIITADDLGLSRHVTDMIFDTDQGVLSQASILANADAFEYALQQYGRHPNLTLACHINLTEGRALSDVPHLTRNGMFKFSPLGLLLRYTFALPRMRRALRDDISREVAAQISRIRGTVPHIAVDGHQHVHMLPFVFDAIVQEAPFVRVRITREPLYLPRLSDLPRVFSRLPALILLRFLARRNRRIAAQRGIPTTEWFLGFLFSGEMTYERIAVGLRKTRGSVEIGLHPGQMRSEETRGQEGGRMDSAWYRSPWRTHEHQLLLDPRLRKLVRNE